MSIKLYHGDCLDILPTLAENSVDAIVTDPPYGIFMMGNKWDYSLPSVEIWKEVLKVLKPGGNLVAFSSTRTYHRLVVNIEDAGFEIRDQLCWLTSQGMPHGLDISKALDKAAGVERKVVGLKNPYYDGRIVPDDPSSYKASKDGNLGKYGYATSSANTSRTEASTDAAKQWAGWATSLKPCVEPIVLCRKPLDGNYVDNILKHGVGGLNIDDCRIPVDSAVDDGTSSLGRFPGNVIFDGSDAVQEIFDRFGEKKSGVPGRRRKAHETHSMSGTLDMLDRDEVGYADRGSVSRFFKSCEYSDEELRIFYCPKVKPKERGASKHPTLKPISLLTYLAKLICPKGGVILDPFAGSGTTGAAAIDEGFSAILIEREEDYINEIKNRLMFFLDD